MWNVTKNSFNNLFIFCNFKIKIIFIHLIKCIINNTAFPPSLNNSSCSFYHASYQHKICHDVKAVLFLSLWTVSVGELELILNIEPDEYINALSPEHGAITFLHTQEYDVTDGARHLVAPGSHHVIDLQKVSAKERM